MIHGKPKIQGQVFFKNEERLLSVIQDTGLYGAKRNYWFYNCATLELNSDEYSGFFTFEKEEDFENYIKKNKFVKQIQKLN